MVNQLQQHVTPHPTVYTSKWLLMSSQYSRTNLHDNLDDIFKFVSNAELDMNPLPLVRTLLIKTLLFNIYFRFIFHEVTLGQQNL